MTPIPLQPTPAPPAETVEERFRRLAAAWHEVAPFHPARPVRYEHPAYQGIFALGPAVVPLLLRALAEYPRDWFWALHVITGADPVPSQERGDFTGMRDAWLRWGRANGYLPPVAADSEGYGPGTPLPPQPPSSPGKGDGGEGAGALPEPDLEKKLQQLAAIWRAETCYLSSSTAMANHPAYQEIFALASAAVPLLLRELEREPDHWSVALRALTGANPIAPADRGKVKQIAQVWLRWGRANGYRW
jgi:hypothetical protein